MWSIVAGSFGLVKSAFCLRRLAKLFLIQRSFVTRAASTAGGRTKLDSLICRLSRGEAELHAHILSLRDKHVAHSDSELEAAGSQIYVAIAEDGSLVRSGLGVGGQMSLGLSLMDLERFGDLAETLVKLVREWGQTLDKVVASEVEAMTDEELRALPDGFPPLGVNLDVNAPRTWPRPERKKGS
jgi:hypothetical protein